LKVTATQAFGSSWLTPVLGEFIELYPDVQVDLVLEDRELDLSMREADVAIRMAPPRQPELIQRHLMTVHLNVYASPAYIKRHGIPKSPEELDAHRVIVYGDDTTKPPVQDIDWLLRAGGKLVSNQRRPILKVNSVYAILRAVQSGLGLASLPEYMAQESTSLVRILPELQGPRIDSYFVYPEELRSSKRIQVFRDFLLRKVAEGKLT
jgi:DNA-binding transcriptional LysR family regulator